MLTHDLAILKRNEKELVKVQDDSELLAIVKGFFASLNTKVEDDDEREEVKIRFNIVMSPG